MQNTFTSLFTFMTVFEGSNYCYSFHFPEKKQKLKGWFVHDGIGSHRHRRAVWHCVLPLSHLCECWIYCPPLHHHSVVEEPSSSSSWVLRPEGSGLKEWVPCAWNHIHRENYWESYQMAEITSNRYSLHFQRTHQWRWKNCFSNSSPVR